MPTAVEVKKIIYSSADRPKDRIAIDGSEESILEQFRMVPHENIDISGLVALVCPDDRVIIHLERIGDFGSNSKNG
jgi:hypothetical protein